jgi:signal-transduction protein with cAMP-binding, CBS, and nucleotidyltransferase domain
VETNKQANSSNVVSKFLEFKNKFHIFRDLCDADILSITKNITFKKYASGEVLMKEGDKGNTIYYILIGKCNIIANRTIVGSFGSNSLVGEIASIKNTPRTATVRVIEESMVFQFEINYDKCDDCPTAFYKYYRNIAFELVDKLDNANKK